MASWHQDDIERALDELTTAFSLPEAQRVLDQHPELLTDQAEQLLRRMIEFQETPEARRLLQAYLELIRRGRPKPVEPAALPPARVVAGDPRRRIDELNEATVEHRRHGRYEQALATGAQALALARQHLGHDSARAAASLNNLGHAATAKGDYQAARQYLEQGLAVFRKTMGPDHPDTAKCLTNLGGLLFAIGDLAAARIHFEQALAVKRKLLGEEAPGTAISWDNLGTLLHELGEYATARSCFEKALAILRLAPDATPVDLATALNNCGYLLISIGDHVGAQSHYEQALHLLRKTYGDHHPDTARCFNNLGFLHKSLKNWHAARGYYEQARSAFANSVGERHADTATVLCNLGELCRIAGDLDEARGHAERALAIRESVLGENHRDTIASLNNVGMLRFDAGDLGAARTYFERALTLRRQVLGHDHADTCGSLINLAGLFVAERRPQQAFPLMREAAAIHDRMIGQVFALASERQRLSYMEHIRFGTELFLSLVAQHLSDRPDAVASAFDLVLRRKSIVAEAGAAERAHVLAGQYGELKQQLEQLATLRMQIARKALGPAGRDHETHQRILAAWNQQKEQLESELAGRIPEIQLGRKLRAADRHAVAQALPAESALLEFVRFRPFRFDAVAARHEPEWQAPRYLAFVLHAGQPNDVHMIDLGTADPIDAMIARYRDILLRAADEGTDRDIVKRKAQSGAERHIDAGDALRVALFDPLVPALHGVRRVLIAPDGDLARLPFEVLPLNGGRYLIDEYQISYVGCGRDAVRWGTVSAAQASASLVIADPEFDLADQGNRAPAVMRNSVRQEDAAGGGSRRLELRHAEYQFSRLPGTRLEGDRVAGFLGVKPWIGAAALEGVLKAKCRSPRVLHVATHGFFLEDRPGASSSLWGEDGLSESPPPGRFGEAAGPFPDNPLLRSGLALAGAQTFLNQGWLPSEAEDGLLTAEDASGLDLLATELVVLSACETGLGKVHVGEGVFGLQRAFSLAGARTLIMSLWKVPDDETRDLMEDFYRRLLAGAPRAEALRSAQLYLKDKYPEPYYWGAFICQGDFAPLCGLRRLDAALD